MLILILISNDQEIEDEDDIACLICLDMENEDDDEIIICDLCNSSCHQSCYGSEIKDSLPEGFLFNNRMVDQ